MKILFIISTIFILVSCSTLLAETYVEEEFIVEGQGQPVYTTTVAPAPVVVTPGSTATVVTTTPTTVLVPGEQEVYIGMNKYHVAEVLGQPTYVEKFRRFTARHHGIYDEVWTYAGPSGNLVLYIKERRVQKIGHE